MRTFWLQSLARGYADSGELQRALDFVNQTLPVTKSNPGSIARWGALRSIAMAAFRWNETVAAVRIASLDHDVELHDFIVHAVAMQMANRGAYPEAEERLAAIESNEARAQTLADVAALGALATVPGARWIVVRDDAFHLDTFKDAMEP
jgi:hypothetical protein